MIDNPDVAALDRDCIFGCGDPMDNTWLIVELNRAPDGTWHAFQDHLNHAERVSGVAHRRCYAHWYEQTYQSPFTMST
jgi:hypothetical protein